MKTIIHIIILLTICQSLVAQKKDPAIIVMKSGSIIEGKIVEWNDNEKITIISPGIRDSIVINQDEIQKIFPSGGIEEDMISAKAQTFNLLAGRAAYDFKHTGFYATAKAQFISGNDGERANGVNGFGISISAGHRFSRLFAVGGGVGYDQFIWNSGEEMIPVFAEVSGYFTPTQTSLFYNIQGGYSYALSDDRYLILDADGGFMFYPSIGIRFGTAKNKLLLDVGYKFQNATYTYRNQWNSTITSEQDLTFKRMSIRLGVIF